MKYFIILACALILFSSNADASQPMQTPQLEQGGCQRGEWLVKYKVKIPHWKPNPALLMNECAGKGICPVAWCVAANSAEQATAQGNKLVYAMQHMKQPKQSEVDAISQKISEQKQADNLRMYELTAPDRKKYDDDAKIKSFMGVSK